MNITILSLRGPTKKHNIRGGAREYLEEICKPWICKGHKITIVCGSEPKFNLYESEEIEGIEIVRVGSGKWSVFSIINYYIKNLKKDTDILIENIVSFPMYIPLIKGSKKNYTIVHHLTDKNYFNTHKLPIAILGYFMEKVTLRMFYKQSKFIAVSDHTRDMLISDGIPKKNINIVNPGMRDNYFKPGVKSKYPKIFYIGRYSGTGGNKRVDHLIDAFKSIQLRYRNAELIIAGKGENESVLKEKAKNLNVKFIGMIDDDQKREQMQSSWIFASPSLAEGFGITWIEANASGTPVVGYKIDGLNTVTDRTSIMVEQGDITALSEAMISLIKNSNKRECMGNEGVKNAKKYGWSKSSEALLNIITCGVGD